MKIDALKGSFPHPVLQEERYDYVTDMKFKLNYELIIDNDNEQIYRYIANIGSNFLKNLLQCNLADFVFHIEQKSYRDVIKVDEINGEIKICKKKFSPDFKITILPTIVSVKKQNIQIPSDEIHTFYSSVKEWSFKKGSVLAVGNALEISVNQEISSLSDLIILNKSDIQKSPFTIVFGKKINVFVSPKFMDLFEKTKKQSKLTNLFLLYNVYFSGICKILQNEECEEERVNYWKEFMLDKIRETGENMDHLYDEHDITSKASELCNKIMENEIYDSYDDQINYIMGA